MKIHSHLNRLVLVLAFVALAPLFSVRADGGGPRQPQPPPPPGAGVTIKVDPKATETHIKITRKELALLQGGLPDISPKKDTGFITTPDHTIMAGLAITLALVLGGLYLARGKRRAGLSALVVVAIIGVSCAGSVAFADRAPSVPPSSAAPQLRFDTAPVNAVAGDAAEFSISQAALRLLKKKIANATTSK
jgi:hypothetical protein